MASIHFFIKCFVLYFFITVLSAFLHQVGHGIGALIDGVSISTGFAAAGDYGKSPEQANFRSELILPGRLSSGGLLGPFVNWIVVISFSMALLVRRKKGALTLVMIILVISNAWIRIFPFLRFLWSHWQGPLFLDDEATWALSLIHEYKWPSNYQTLEELSTTKSYLVKSQLWIYFWPVVSAIISFTGLSIATKKTFNEWSEYFQTISTKVMFVSVPILAGPLVLITVTWLDRWLRLNWGG
jgi:hypothetical protein